MKTLTDLSAEAKKICDKYVTKEDWDKYDNVLLKMRKLIYDAYGLGYEEGIKWFESVSKRKRPVSTTDSATQS